MLGPGPKGGAGDESGGALRSVAGVAAELAKEVNAFRLQQFEEWEVGGDEGY